MSKLDYDFDVDAIAKIVAPQLLEASEYKCAICGASTIRPSYVFDLFICISCARINRIYDSKTFLPYPSPEFPALVLREEPTFGSVHNPLSDGRRFPWARCGYLWAPGRFRWSKEWEPDIGTLRAIDQEISKGRWVTMVPQGDGLPWKDVQPEIRGEDTARNREAMRQGAAFCPRCERHHFAYQGDGGCPRNEEPRPASELHRLRLEGVRAELEYHDGYARTLRREVDGLERLLAEAERSEARLAEERSK